MLVLIVLFVIRCVQSQHSLVPSSTGDCADIRCGDVSKTLCIGNAQLYCKYDNPPQPNIDLQYQQGVINLFLRHPHDISRFYVFGSCIFSICGETKNKLYYCLSPFYCPVLTTTTIPTTTTTVETTTTATMPTTTTITTTIPTTTTTMKITTSSATPVKSELVYTTAPVLNNTITDDNKPQKFSKIGKTIIFIFTIIICICVIILSILLIYYAYRSCTRRGHYSVSFTLSPEQPCN